MDRWVEWCGVICIGWIRIKMVLVLQYRCVWRVRFVFNARSLSISTKYVGGISWIIESSSFTTFHGVDRYYTFQYRSQNHHQQHTIHLRLRIILGWRKVEIICVRTRPLSARYFRRCHFTLKRYAVVTSSHYVICISIYACYPCIRVVMYCTSTTL